MSAHEWIRQFVKELRLLRPQLTEEMLQLIADAYCAEGDPKLAARNYHNRIQGVASSRPIQVAVTDSAAV